MPFCSFTYCPFLSTAPNRRSEGRSSLLNHIIENVIDHIIDHIIDHLIDHLIDHMFDHIFDHIPFPSPSLPFTLPSRPPATPDPLPDPLPFSLLVVSFSYFLLFFELSRCIKSEFAGVSLTLFRLNILGLEAKFKQVKTSKNPK